MLTLRRDSGPRGADLGDYIALEPTDAFAVARVDHLSRTPGEGVPVAGYPRPLRPVDPPGPEPTQAVPGFVRAH